MGANIDMIARSEAISAKNEFNKSQIYCIKRSDYRYEIWMKNFNNKWVVYEVWRNITAGDNKDSWRVYKARVTEIAEVTPLLGTTESNPIELVSEGSQWEYAIRPQGAPDFFGGFHGDEMMQKVIFIVDGKPKSISSLANMALNRFEMVQHTYCYHPTDGTTKLGDMYVRHIFTLDGFQLKFKLLWSANVTIENAYGAMLPANRSSQVSTQCRLVDRPNTHNISVTPHERPGGNSYGMELWNTSNNLGMAVEFDDLSWFNNYAQSGNRGVFVSDSQYYNKVYPARVFSDSANLETVEPGDVWELSARYRIFNRS